MKMKRILTSILAGSLLAATAMTACADHDRWQDLSDGEQEILRKYRGDWQGLPEDDRRRLRSGARKYLSLPPSKQDAIRRQRDQYQRMSPEERERLRERYQHRKDRH